MFLSETQYVAGYDCCGSNYSRSGFWRDRGFSAAPKGSQSQAKGQKSTEYVFVMLLIVSGADII